MNKLHCLIVNLGSPSSTKESDVAKFLRQFLMDKNVLRMPWVLRAFLVNFIIVPNRKKHSSKLYSQIWSDGKSPLISNTEKLVAKIETKLADKKCDIELSFAMRYGEYSIDDKIKELSKKGVEKLLVLPMYPHYEQSTYQSSVDEVNRCTKKCGVTPFYISPFFNHGDYLAALERSIREGLNGITVDKLLFTFHGVPLSYLPCGEKRAKECDNKVPNISQSQYCAECYKYQCLKTAEEVAIPIGADKQDYSIAFQSRLGRKEWLSPSLPKKIRLLIADGNKNIGVIAPSFTVDCLETLHEIDIEARKEFIGAGGENFHYIPAINDLDLWAKKVAKWIIEFNKNNK